MHQVNTYVREQHEIIPQNRFEPQSFNRWWKKIYCSGGVRKTCGPCEGTGQRPPASRAVCCRNCRSNRQLLKATLKNTSPLVHKCCLFQERGCLTRCIGFTEPVGG